ncbi:lactate dehydrogenase-like oxidoreductase [Sporocytophaga myxococcoides]|uniref:Lactate dehydrogenase-like oxidoreductase n=1 Tax=Sporocytophaga myxococcoides TaxID=153721 RepID=A0A098LHG2_9BACT|nr:2-hydroxyacid dehydrogenase [Sporocytophaga myxococcoides]GAL86380.1 lactate dehydrogenase-like oxidoreductase [Sporocytophaga myxococcoides]
MKLAIYSTKPYERKYLESANKGKHELCFFEEALSSETVYRANGCDAISIFTNDDASAEVLEIIKKLNIRSIAVRAAGYDNVDLKKATELSFKVANVPDYSPYSIAEHTAMLILALNRKVVQADHKVKDYNFLLDELIGFDLNGRTVGIIGVGKIGGILAKIMNGFGCKVLGFDIKENKDYTEKYNLQYVSLDEMYQKADIISLHAPLNEHTKFMINKESISKMKDRVMIVNTGRGGLINTIDAIDALKSGKIGYLGLDVYEKEKGLFFYNHSADIMKDDVFARLLTFKNVIITGHQAFLTDNALKNISDTTIYNIDCWQSGNKSKNELC